MGSNAPPERPTIGQRYQIRAGDTLSRLAFDAFGDARRYLEIYEINKDVIGPNPARLPAGVEILIPEPEYISMPRSLFGRGTVGQTYKAETNGAGKS
jgi:hypothetical protein